MEDIKIIEYSPLFAKGIAEMWNKSTDNWGGNNVVKTEETILREHENLTFLNVFLAVKGKEVIGYCRLSEYKEDEGGLYISLLNVRPDYHGKKIGKSLVIRAIERTIELGWPRLDLYTWPGNTKAVPLYKKCGFFWEKRDGMIHFMNFIPTVLQTEILKDYFETFHWYNDAKREILIEPDGRIENGFEYYEYLWEKNGKRLRVEFERLGRGIRLIETDDYMVSAMVENKNLIFGRKYKVFYKILNKTGEPLNVSIKGLNDKNIIFSLDKSMKVVGEKTIEGEFYVGEIFEEQSKWRTHPAVSAEIMINGKKALFRVGIVPMFPAKLSMIVPDYESFKNVKSECYIEVVNNFKEEAEFVFILSDSENIRFLKKKFNVKLKGNGKDLITIPYILKDFSFYSANIPVTVQLNNGEIINFRKNLSAAFKGRTGRFGGETENSWIICNGSYSLELNKFNNKLTIKSFIKDLYNIFINYPKIGRPFSTEFSKKRVEKVEYFKENDAMVLKAVYRSKYFENIEVVSVSKLYANGILEHHYEVYNLANNETEQEIWLNESIFYDFFRAVIPYENRIIELKGSYGRLIDYWEGSKVTENWIFSQGDKITRGLCWHKDYRVVLNEELITIEHNFGKLAAKEYKSTKPIYIALGTFKNWQEFRDFALKKVYSEKLSPSDHFDMIVNGGNPFVKDSFKVKIRDYKQTYFNGKITLISETSSFKPVEKKYTESDQIRETEFLINIKKNIDLDLLKLDVNFNIIEFQRKIAIFQIKDREIKRKISKEDGIDVYSMENGVLEIKAAPSFSNSLFSLIYNNHEWLDSSFPKPKPKSWWNPWTGGLVSAPMDLIFSSILEEKRMVNFVDIEDNYQNKWSGIKISYELEKNDKYCGLKLNQYYLLLPGLPVLCFTTEIIQNTGSLFNFVDFYTIAFLKPDSEITKSWFISRNLSGEMIKYKAGINQEIHSHSPVLFGSENRKEKVLFFAGQNSTNLIAFANNEVIAGLGMNKIIAKNNDKVFTPPIFLIFTEEYLPEVYLKDLKNIWFD
ncbi:hypothetical protein BBF96_04220 [Anoxybacter fermentans]|uniref:N-acetyltransferase domain-containing protein n=1 Tax=Anoxybacter fermentans TaxID=1323375 RepID=A0A3S9SWF7_9FIRM|nr:GNAT family N-acetyltransferase [Anoxybacter fermentans]AZR72663.1 hypothetical protein BBF96_04220 [Anoxybacter fermentans]